MGAATAFAGSFAFSMAAGSTRSAESMGSDVSGCWAKGTSGAECQDELLAKDSWAARSRAAAPSPKTSSDIDNMIAANRKRKPGSMARGILAKADGGERGGHWVELICARETATNQVHTRIAQRLCDACEISPRFEIGCRAVTSPPQVLIAVYGRGLWPRSGRSTIPGSGNRSRRWLEPAKNRVPGVHEGSSRASTTVIVLPGPPSSVIPRQ